jgi:hypothetical protein
MKKVFLSLVVLGFVSCTQTAPVQKPNVICTFASVGLNMGSQILVGQLGTCSASKLSDKILEVFKCPTVQDKSIASATASFLCPYAVNVLTSIGSVELQKLECNPKIIEEKAKTLCAFIK